MGGSKMRPAVNHMWIVLFIFSFYTVQYSYIYSKILSESIDKVKALY